MTIELFRVSHKGKGLGDADTIEGAREIVQGQPPGRYEVDEMRAQPWPSGHTSRQRRIRPHRTTMVHFATSDASSRMTRCVA